MDIPIIAKEAEALRGRVMGLPSHSKQEADLEEDRLFKSPGLISIIAYCLPGNFPSLHQLDTSAGPESNYICLLISPKNTTGVNKKESQPSTNCELKIREDHRPKSGRNFP